MIDNNIGISIKIICNNMPTIKTDINTIHNSNEVTETNTDINTPSATPTTLTHHPPQQQRHQHPICNNNDINTPSATTTNTINTLS